MLVQEFPPSVLYFIPLVTPDRVPVSGPVAVKEADGVVSCVFAVASASVRLTAAVGVPETVICV